MGFEDLFRLSVHAVITDPDDRVLLLRADYGDRAWGLPGGALEPGETVHEALRRECGEELGCGVEIRYLSGIYYHSSVNSHALVFRCDLPIGTEIQLSREHTDWRFHAVSELQPVQRIRVEDCLSYRGDVRSRRF